MKYFRVEEEYIAGYTTLTEVLSDGAGIEDSEREGSEFEAITLGYFVHEMNEQGIVERVMSYPVFTNMETMDNNHEEVLEQIKRDYPAGEWQNNDW